MAHQEDSSPSIPQPQISKNNESKPTCISEMNQQANIPSAPRNIRSFATVCSQMPAIHQTQQPVYRIRPEGPEIQVQSCPNQCQPGLMAATHLARIDRVGMGHQGPSFFGFGCTIVVETPNSSVQTLHGNTLVHLFTPPFLPYVNAPTPLLEGRAERARIKVFRPPYELPNFPRTTPFKRPPQSFRLHQGITAVNSPAQSRVL